MSRRRVKELMRIVLKSVKVVNGLVLWCRLMLKCENVQATYWEAAVKEGGVLEIGGAPLRPGERQAGPCKTPGRTGRSGPEQ